MREVCVVISKATGRDGFVVEVVVLVVGGSVTCGTSLMAGLLVFGRGIIKYHYLTIGTGANARNRSL